MPFNVRGVVDLEVCTADYQEKRVLVFPANPDQHFSRDIRVTVMQSDDSIYTDDFGLGIQTLTLQGTTAWRSAQGRFNGQPVDGESAARHLQFDMIDWYFSMESAGPSPQGMIMTIYDHAFSRAWTVKPIGNIQFSITSSSPVTRNFSLQFLVLSDLTNGVTVTPIVDPVVQILKSPKQIEKYTKSQVKAVKQTTKANSKKPPFVYTVQSGDSLWSISKQFLSIAATDAQIETFVRDVSTQNHLANPNLIFPGERLIIPRS
jgi:LysM repeat protein